MCIRDRLLDEPTNHLDLEMRQALAMALQDFQGAMVLVSHDRHLLRVSCDQLLLVHGGAVGEFPGSLDDYPKWLADRDKGEAAESEANGGEHTAGARKERKRIEAEMRRKYDPLRKTVKQAEQKIEMLHTRQKSLEGELAQPQIYESQNKERLKALLSEKVAVGKECAEWEERWMEASEELERLQSAL